MSGEHAVLSPSGFKALMICAAKPAMERGRPDTAGKDAALGTAAHTLMALCFADQRDARAYLGRIIDGFPVDDDMADAVQAFVDYVNGRVNDYKVNGYRVQLLVEQRVPIGHITGEEGAEGTADVIITAVHADGRTVFEVLDYKHGRGVEVEAHMNPQVMLYALGAVHKLYQHGDVNRCQVVMGIHQPRITPEPSTFSVFASQLIEWGNTVAAPAGDKAMRIYIGLERAADNLTPAEEACRFCRAKAVCPALAGTVTSAIDAEFTDLTTESEPAREDIIESLTVDLTPAELAARMAAVPLIEAWCKSIRALSEVVLLAGGEVPGFKLVAGKRGARSWRDITAAEAALKGFRLKKAQMYDLSLISPTAAEKLLKSTPKRWSKLQQFIQQSEGKPSVAPVSDKRPALEVKPVEAEFAAIAEPAEDLI